ncbi:MAG: hypothetical protein LBI18_11815, partial [Planctomycetaceae bacterium]|nr:hypothetical protein [Planctomycetaceae bacterium]
MRNLMTVLVLFLVLTTTRVFGQETFAPLMTDHTVLCVHLDLRKIELDTIKSQVEKLGEELLRQLRFDEKSFNATTRELKNELEKLNQHIRPPYETVTKELGIQELAILADLDLLESGISFVLAAPWKNKTDKDLETLRLLCFEIFSDRIFPLNNPKQLSQCVFPVGDFLFFVLPISDYNEISRLALIAWLQERTPTTETKRIQQGLQVLEQQDEFKIVAALPEQLKTRVASAMLFQNDVPQEMLRLFAFGVQKIEWAAASFPINALFSDEKINDVFLTVKTAKRIDAVQLRGLLENAIEFGINAAKYTTEQNETDFPLPPLFFEFMKGVMRTWLPDVEDDKLIFRLKGEGTVA